MFGTTYLFNRAETKTEADFKCGSDIVCETANDSIIAKL